ncbi:phenylalanine 4-monooxygenase [Streptomyces sp. NPDC012794]|uniref:phenylalanine 4-monooxygenase n=1 Tax=Streptomyces sp. NPDC012794 TaxID=3364850 RepID=UPI0036B12E17
MTPVREDGRLGSAEAHPASADPVYVRRRDAIVASAAGHQVGAPSPIVEYTAAEHGVWRRVHAALAGAREGRVCRVVEAACRQAPIPSDRVPQHAEVGDRLRELSGFTCTLAGGIVPNKRFLGAMADRYFHAAVQAAPGCAPVRLDSDDALDLISRVYWYRLGYGTARENGTVKAYGAALLSSYRELHRFHRARIRRWNILDLVRQPYQVTGYQPLLFAVDCLDHLAEELHAFSTTSTKPPANDTAFHP